MHHKKQTLIYLSISAVVFFVTIFLDEYHYETFGDFLQLPGLLSVISFILLIIMYFLPPPVLSAWGKFTLFYIPIAVILVVMSPRTRGGYFNFGGGGIGGGADKESSAWFLSGLYFIISLILIIRAHRRYQ